MIFLDANAFYSYFGRERLGLSSSPVSEYKLTKYLDKKAEKSLPTSVFIEIVTHFRDNAKLLKQMLDFRYKKGLPLYNNIPDYVIDENEITCVGLMDESMLIKYSYTLLHKKINIETKFTLLFFEITKNIYTHYKLESASKLTPENKSSLLFFIGKTIHKEYADLLETKMKEELVTGYERNKEQKVLKDFYIQELNKACIITDIIIAASIAYKDEQADIIEAIQTEHKSAVISGLDGKSGTMHYIIDTLKEDIKFLNIAKSKISDMFKKGKYSDNQRGYLRDIMFPAWLERGQKLEKNDIFDMFCVGCLDYIDKGKRECALVDTSSYIITFDKTMKSYLSGSHPENIKIINDLLNQ